MGAWKDYATTLGFSIVATEAMLGQQAELHRRITRRAAKRRR
jgi:hypothetical protein